MGFHIFPLIFLQILCYSLIETAPLKPSMSNEILRDRNALLADKVIQSIWQRDPSNSCDMEKPPETRLTEKSFLDFNFVAYLCVILYDASIRYLNLNISYTSNEIQDGIADNIIEDALPDTFCIQMKDNKWYTSVDANKRWVSHFNDVMKNETLCRRYCVSEIVNPLCAYALWIDSAVKKKEHFHSQNTKAKELPKAQPPPLHDVKQHPAISAVKQPQAVKDQFPVTENDNQNPNIGVKHPATSSEKHNINAGNAMDNTHNLMDLVVGEQTVNPLLSREYNSRPVLNPEEGQSIAGGQRKGNVPTGNSHDKMGLTGTGKATSSNEVRIFDNNPNVRKAKVPSPKPPPVYVDPNDELTQIQQQKHVDEQRALPQGKPSGDLGMHESFSNEGNTSPIEGIRLDQGQAELPGGTTSSDSAGQTGQGPSQKITIDNPPLEDSQKIVNAEQNLVVPDFKVSATSVQNDNAAGGPTKPLERPDSSPNIAPPGEMVNTTVPEAKVKEVPGSNKEESAESKPPTISKSEPEDANQANEADINAGAAPEPDNHEEQKALEEVAVGGREEDSDLLGGHGEAPPQESEDELLEQQDTLTEEPRFNGGDETPVKLDAASTKITNNDFGAGSEEDDPLWPQAESGRAVQNDADAGYAHDRFVDAEDSHFFAYFMTMIILCIIGYLIFHNKQKILALALEGRVRKGSRRRPSTSGYRKLDSNLEEAVTSSCTGSSVTHVIY